MRRHLLTIILLLFATIAFVLRFCVVVKWQFYFDIATFALPTFASIVEIYVSEKNGKKNAAEIRKMKKNQLSLRVEGHKAVFGKGV